MSEIVASRFWVCEICNLPLYGLDDMKSHLKEAHGVDCGNPLANAGIGGDNLIVSSRVVPVAALDKIHG